jgi:hypothetical protein
MSEGTERYFRKFLGMNQGSAQWKLRKSIMFHQAVRLNENICYRCGERIEKADEFSVDHKEPWLYSENAIDSFFNLENVSFSHCRCNTKAKRPPSKRFEKELGLS